jgi:hypothetical protein
MRLKDEIRGEVWAHVFQEGEAVGDPWIIQRNMLSGFIGLLTSSVIQVMLGTS